MPAERSKAKGTATKEPAVRKKGRPDYAAITAAAEKKALAAGATVYEDAGMSTQLVTAPRLDDPTPGLQVEWIGWESGFRDSDVRPGDVVVAVDGKRVERPATPEELSKALPTMLGQYSESQAWAAAGRKEGDNLALTVRRRKEGQGWEEVDVAGTLRGEHTWTDAAGRRLFGPLGPDQMVDDGFTGPWFGWYEQVVRAWTPLLDPWARLPGSSDYVRGEHEKDEKRVRALEKRYPGGPFAAAVGADWGSAHEILQGRSVTLDKDALEFRRLGEERAGDIRGAGQAARTAFLEVHEKDVIPPFPAIDPVFGNKRDVEGKLTELPTVGNQQWIAQGEGTIFVFNQGDQYYFAAGESAATEAMLQARLRYEQRVMPVGGSDFAMVGRITARTALMVVGRRAVWGLMVEPVAVTIGDEALFVDLTGAGSDPPPAFAGEELLASGSASVPPDDAPPEAVLAAAFAALKLGEKDVWRSLYAGWYVWFSDTGLPVVNIGGNYNHDSNWELARRMILGDVADVRVRWVDDAVPVVKGDEFEGAPKVDQVIVDVEHLRQEKDRAARSFTDVGLNRTWVLQRFDGGPWRITSNQAI